MVWWSLQRAEGEFERYVVVVERGFGGVVGGDEADVECVFVGADFGDARYRNSRLMLNICATLPPCICWKLPRNAVK